MAEQTTNLGLTLPAGTELVSRQVINQNWAIIDEAYGEMDYPQLLTKDTDYTCTVDDTLVSAFGTYLYKLSKNKYYIDAIIKNATAVNANGSNLLTISIPGKQIAFENYHFSCHLASSAVPSNSYFNLYAYIDTDGILHCCNGRGSAQIPIGVNFVASGVFYTTDAT